MAFSLDAAASLSLGLVLTLQSIAALEPVSRAVVTSHRLNARSIVHHLSGTALYEVHVLALADSRQTALATSPQRACEVLSLAGDTVRFLTALTPGTAK